MHCSELVGGLGCGQTHDLVAVGSDWSGADQDAAVWTSVDGITWPRVLHDEALFGGEHGQRMTSVTTGGPGLVAVGSEFSVGDWDVAVWVAASED